MKKTLFIGFICMIAISSCTQNQTQIRAGKERTREFVDLGLPSGTQWCTTNEEGLFKFKDAEKQFGSMLPTYDQINELNDLCEWSWIGMGYTVKGPNGNQITIPAEGSCDCGGKMYGVGSRRRLLVFITSHRQSLCALS